MNNSSNHLDDRYRLTLLWTEAQPAVAAFIRSQVRNSLDGDDLIQQTALTVVERFEEFETGRSFVAWSIGIAKYKVLAYFRDQGRSQVRLSHEAVEQVAQSMTEQSSRISDHAVALESCMKRLKEKDRRLVVLRYGQGLLPVAIAKLIGTTPGVVSVNLSRVRVGLKRCIDIQINVGGQ